MPGLESKWATADPEPVKKEAPVSTKPAPKAPSTVQSKWATAEPEETEPKKTKKPKSKNHEKHPKQKAEKPHDDSYKGKVQELTPPQSSEGHEDMSDLAKSFASRLGTKDTEEQPSGNSKGRRNRRKSHNKPAEPQQKGHKEDPNAWEDVSDEEEEDLFEDKLYEKGPMTDAAKAVSMRIGIATNEPEAPKKAQAPREQKEPRGAKEPKAPKEPKESKEPKATYMTPKQKKLLLEKQKQEKLRGEQAEKERKIREEVKAMFDQMEDKSTNWADIDD
ncbi:hypothetical protein FT663_00190 [Candidozyma haemuli var. vulneris]|uniref:Uncharacterized protein n=1 Tax=Candidozyma haemuli TaxID=45357 RepID=A0A2V1AP63_9ASCO|nr:hypothetical protein CXQ85_001017 [[Candida] haemuloni]KAF3994220.1 hypothetical protein FT662_00089 [[Candida] haemuloni var. vulneris]KAF3995768.1 hypothetical protein FT663_00190 [[Candida] haemuloni var. vulneris]PVH18731.1 hypothetical protein CXQ85_001017 [[Candida] haemuloni]